MSLSKPTQGFACDSGNVRIGNCSRDTEYRPVITPLLETNRMFPDDSEFADEAGLKTLNQLTFNFLREILRAIM